MEIAAMLADTVPELLMPFANLPVSKSRMPSSLPEIVPELLTPF
jgi:hypothetical protein